jgi:hypothetical protein
MGALRQILLSVQRHDRTHANRARAGGIVGGHDAGRLRDAARQTRDGRRRRLSGRLQERPACCAGWPLTCLTRRSDIENAAATLAGAVLISILRRSLWRRCTRVNGIERLGLSQELDALLQGKRRRCVLRG